MSKNLESLYSMERQLYLQALGSSKAFVEFRESEYADLTSTDIKTLLTTLQLSTSLTRVNLVCTVKFESERDFRGKLWRAIFANCKSIRRVEIDFMSYHSKSFLDYIAEGFRDNQDLAVHDLTLNMFYAFPFPIARVVRACAPALSALTLCLSDQLLTWSEAESQTLASALREAASQRLQSLTVVTFSGFLEGRNPIASAFELPGPALPSLTLECPLFHAGGCGLPLLAAANIRELVVRLTRRIFLPSYFDSGRSNALIWWYETLAGLRGSALEALVVELDYNLFAFMHHHGDPLKLGNPSVGSPKLHFRAKIDLSAPCDRPALARRFERAVVSGRPVAVDQLWLHHTEGHARRWRRIFGSLRAKRELCGLRLSGSWVGEDNFKDLMTMIQSNPHLCAVDLSGAEWAEEEEGRVSLIQEALARNSNMSHYFSIMREANLAFGQAKGGRILLCGAPFAGKTLLKKTMMRCCSRWSESESIVKKSIFRPHELLSKADMRRTKGAEVELLVDDDHRKIHIWDLAGQYIFRGLQELIFPRTNQAFIFLFVFSPLDRHSRQPKKNLYEAFRDELRQWLRFLASNCLITSYPPKVMAALTHRDLLRHANVDLAIVKYTMDQLQHEFEGLIELRSDPRDLYFVDAGSKRGVRRFTARVLELMDEELVLKTSGVPLLCSQLITQLALYTRSPASLPVWTASAFHAFCSRSHSAMAGDSADPLDASVLQAVTSYLHDIGAVFVVPGRESSASPWIVVNVNWLSENFLGNFVCQGHGFEAGGSSGSSAGGGASSADGFIGDLRFKQLLSDVVHARRSRRRRRAWRQIKVGMLEDLMQGLDLCYRFLSADSWVYYVPIIAGGPDGRSAESRMRDYYYQHEWDSESLEGCTLLGYRMKCADPRTMLSSAFFSRFQIHLRHQLMATLHIKEEEILCFLGYMKLKHNGLEIIIESDESGGEHIDILVKRSSQPQPQQVTERSSRSALVSFLHTHIMRELVSFCASPRGCPGVTLVKGILRTESVRLLVPIHERKEPWHCVMESDLKEQFRSAIKHRLEDSNGGDLFWDSLLDFQYTWPKPRFESDLGLFGGSESAEALLDDKVLKDLVVAVQNTIDKSDLHQRLIHPEPPDNQLITFEISAGVDSRSDEGPEAGLLSSHPGARLDGDEYLVQSIDQLSLQVIEVGRKIMTEMTKQRDSTDGRQEVVKHRPSRTEMANVQNKLQYRGGIYAV